MTYYGGKSRWIDTVWQRIGKVGVWSEPCCGTAVMTLNNPEPAPREVICELNAYIANFYRSLVADYPQTAWYADWPTNHHDLTARHRWLLAQGPELRERMVADPDDYDPKIAGWWVWGQSSWIGHGWCDEANTSRDRIPKVHHGQGVMQQSALTLGPVEDKRPKVPDGGGSGVSAQRDRVPGDQMPNVAARGSPGGVSQQRAAVPHDKRPRIYPRGGGTGVNMQRDNVPGDKIPFVNPMPGARGVSMQRVSVPDKIPLFSNSASGLPSGSGVQIQRRGFQGDNRVRLPEGDGILDGSRLRPWFRAIAERLARVHHPQPRVGMGAYRQRPATDAQQPQAAGWRVPRPAVPHQAQGRRQAVDRSVPGRQRGDK